MLKNGIALKIEYVLFAVKPIMLLEIIGKALVRQSIETEMFTETSCSEERCRRVYRYPSNS